MSQFPNDAVYELNVIHIDDSPEYLDELKVQVNDQDLQWNLQGYINPEKALAKIQLLDGDIHCVFLDIEFPNSMSGFDFLRKFRKINNTAVVYIVSNYDNDADVFETYSTSREEIESLGMVGWIQKNKDPNLSDINDLVLKFKHLLEMVFSFYEKKVIASADEIDRKSQNVLYNTSGIMNFIENEASSSLLYREIKHNCISVIRNTAIIKSQSDRLRDSVKWKNFPSFDAELYSNASELVAEHEKKMLRSRLDRLLQSKIDQSPTSLNRFRVCLKKYLSRERKRFTKAQLYYVIDNSLKRNPYSKPSTKFEILAFIIADLFNDAEDNQWSARLLVRCAQRLQSANNKHAAVTVSKLALEKAALCKDLELVAEISELI